MFFVAALEGPQIQAILDWGKEWAPSLGALTEKSLPDTTSFFAQKRIDLKHPADQLLGSLTREEDSPLEKASAGNLRLCVL